MPRAKYRDKVSSATRPVKELKGFQRITLAPGETKTVALEITPEHLAFYNTDMKSCHRVGHVYEA